MLTLRVMSEAEIRILYTFHMTRDFPPSELKSLTAILNLCERNEYDVLEARENGSFIAYALVYRPQSGRILLLDYLAVEPEIRCRGYGHQLPHRHREKILFFGRKHGLYSLYQVCRDAAEKHR